MNSILFGRIIAFGFAMIFSFLTSNWIKDLLVGSGFPEPVATLGQIMAFFLTLLIFYRLVKVVIRVDVEE